MLIVRLVPSTDRCKRCMLGTSIWLGTRLLVLTDADLANVCCVCMLDIVSNTSVSFAWSLDLPYCGMTIFIVLFGGGGGVRDRGPRQAPGDVLREGGGEERAARHQVYG